MEPDLILIHPNSVNCASSIYCGDDISWIAVARSMELEIWFQEAKILERENTNDFRIFTKMQFPSTIHRILKLQFDMTSNAFLIIFGNGWNLLKIPMSRNQSVIFHKSIDVILSGKFDNSVDDILMKNSLFDAVQISPRNAMVVVALPFGLSIMLHIFLDDSDRWQSNSIFPVSILNKIVKNNTNGHSIYRLYFEKSVMKSEGDISSPFKINQVTFLNPFFSETNKSCLLSVLYENDISYAGELLCPRQVGLLKISLTVELPFIEISDGPWELKNVCPCSHLAPWFSPNKLFLVDQRSARVCDEDGPIILCVWDPAVVVTSISRVLSHWSKHINSNGYIVSDTFGGVFLLKISDDNKSILRQDINPVRFLQGSTPSEIVLLGGTGSFFVFTLEYNGAELMDLVMKSNHLMIQPHKLKSRFSASRVKDLSMVTGQGSSLEILMFLNERGNSGSLRCLEHGFWMDVIAQDSLGLDGMLSIYTAKLDNNGHLLLFSDKALGWSYAMFASSDGAVSPLSDTNHSVKPIETSSSLLLMNHPTYDSVIQVTDTGVFILHPELLCIASKCWYAKTKLEFASTCGSLLVVGSEHSITIIEVENGAVIERSNFDISGSISALTARDQSIAVSLWDSNEILIFKTCRLQGYILLQFQSSILEQQKSEFQIRSLCFVDLLGVGNLFLAVGTSNGLVSIFSLEKSTLNFVVTDQVGNGPVRIFCDSHLTSQGECDFIYVNGTRDAVFFKDENGIICGNKVCNPACSPRIAVVPYNADIFNNCHGYVWLQRRSDQSDSSSLDLYIGTLELETVSKWEDIPFKECPFAICYSSSKNLIFVGVHSYHTSTTSIKIFDSSTFQLQWEVLCPPLNDSTGSYETIVLIPGYPVSLTQNYAQPPGQLLALVSMTSLLSNDEISVFPPPPECAIVVYELSFRPSKENTNSLLSLESCGASIKFKGACYHLVSYEQHKLVGIVDSELFVLGWRLLEEAKLEFMKLGSTQSRGNSCFTEVLTTESFIFAVEFSKRIMIYVFDEIAGTIVPLFENDMTLSIGNCGLLRVLKTLSNGGVEMIIAMDVNEDIGRSVRIAKINTEKKDINILKTYRLSEASICICPTNRGTELIVLSRGGQVSWLQRLGFYMC